MDPEALQQLAIARDFLAAEVAGVEFRDQPERYRLETLLRLGSLSQTIKGEDVRTVSEQLLEAVNTGVYVSYQVEAMQLERDAKLWEFRVLGEQNEVLRRQLADQVARELTESNLEVARETAKATRVTAWATVALAIVTVVLICATLVTAAIANR